MMRYGSGYGDMMGGGWFVGLIMLAVGALFVAAVVLFVIWAIRAASGHGAVHPAAPTAPAAGQHDPAIAIARERFAKGEIDKDAFDEITRSLGA